MNYDTGDEVYNDIKDEAQNARQNHNGSYFYKLNQELSGQAEIGAYRVYGITEDQGPENDTIS
ncbi:hypothetical protein [Phosphitispora fastidiosa]|uniref:hypothetical protein n=1 Tax=Phosphitispora fastidiosa TaxID=2837202 RepID=UPI001E477829|nr:hypothetical protein [Phosphitispora fastidiosa]MBU7008109.1 hypothetical protein [Phosphitispora fastidiosa]